MKCMKINKVLQSNYLANTISKEVIPNEIKEIIDELREITI